MSKRNYELLLALGADMSVARTTVAELLSPLFFGTTGVHLATRDVLHLRSHVCGEMRDFVNAADRANVREKVIKEKPCIVMGACLGRWQTGSRKAKRCEVEDCLAGLRHGGVRNPVGPRAPLPA